MNHLADLIEAKILDRTGRREWLLSSLVDYDSKGVTVVATSVASEDAAIGSYGKTDWCLIVVVMYFFNCWSVSAGYQVSKVVYEMEHRVLEHSRTRPAYHMVYRHSSWHQMLCHSPIISPQDRVSMILECHILCTSKSRCHESTK